ncbi:hypothetical protein GQ44DRAFT_733568 [Phaeosphaeriaceae sp. PMI808]|nr:hypothetical protein GQ44DRAFT_733568 [Phaeosphaeriaceae sp. PMI808]
MPESVIASHPNIRRSTSPQISGPFEWYDLLAEDAIISIQEHNAASGHWRWDFNKFSLSRRQTPRHTPNLEVRQVQATRGSQEYRPAQELTVEPWNTATQIELSGDELMFFEHYIVVVIRGDVSSGGLFLPISTRTSLNHQTRDFSEIRILLHHNITASGPILDLFDLARHFSSVVPHPALRNVGLLKSLLAVGACHMALDLLERTKDPSEHIDTQTTAPPRTPASTQSSSMTVLPDTRRIAEQYYYEALHYLAQTLLYPSYTCSYGILATAILMYHFARRTKRNKWRF